MGRILVNLFFLESFFDFLQACTLEDTLNQFCGYLRIIVVTFLPLHQRFSQQSLLKSLVSGFRHLIVAE